MRRLLILLATLVVALPAAPALTGCDSTDPVSCDTTGELVVVETTPDDAVVRSARVTGSDCVSLDYEGRLPDGQVFDRGESTEFFIRGTVRGFQDAVIGRRVGESIRVTIPPQLGYGSRRQPAGRFGVEIPPCSTLEFDIRIRDVAPPSVCGG